MATPISRRPVESSDGSGFFTIPVRSSSAASAVYAESKTQGTGFFTTPVRSRGAASAVYTDSKTNLSVQVLLLGMVGSTAKKELQKWEPVLQKVAQRAAKANEERGAGSRVSPEEDGTPAYTVSISEPKWKQQGKVTVTTPYETEEVLYTIRDIQSSTAVVAEKIFRVYPQTQ